MMGLNAPYGARCFLTRPMSSGGTMTKPSLNAPYGARCFLTTYRQADYTVTLLES